jgi:hypothetical protein
VIASLRPPRRRVPGPRLRLRHRVRRAPLPAQPLPAELSTGLQGCGARDLGGAARQEAAEVHPPLPALRPPPHRGDAPAAGRRASQGGLRAPGAQYGRLHARRVQRGPPRHAGRGCGEARGDAGGRVSNGEGRARLTIEDVLRSYAAVAREEIRREHLSQSCVASTWLTIETLGQYGVEAHPLEVLLSIGNRTYKRLRAERGAPRTQEELEGWYEECGAHVIGVGFDLPTAGTIGGHIVAAVGTSFLVDASIGCRRRDSNPRHADYDSAALTD